MQVLSITPIKRETQESSCIFMDNLTLSCALRVILGYENNSSSYRLFTPTKLERYRADKHDYSLDDSLRLGIDIAALSQLVQALVTHDKIFVDSAFINRWGCTKLTKTGSIVTLPKQIECLSPIVRPIKLEEAERVHLLEAATRKAIGYCQSDAFKKFMAVLSLSPIEGMFIDMTSAYYETGFCDQNLLPDELLEDKAMIKAVADTGVVNDLKGVKKHVWSRIVERTEWAWEIVGDEELQQFVRRRKLLADVWKFLTWAIQERDDKYDHEPTSWLDAAEAILRNAVATYFYYGMANRCGAPYLPHVLRSKFCLFDCVASANGLVSTADRAVKALEEQRSIHVQPLNAFYQNDVLDIEVPSVLAWVLEKSESPSEIIEVALDLRGSEQACRFRQWATQVDRRLADGTMNPKQLAKEINEIRELTCTWSNGLFQKEPKTTVEFSLGLGLIRVSKPIDYLKLGRIVRRRWKRHLIFLQRLYQVSDRTARFSNLVGKVFGERMQEFYEKYCSHFQRRT